MKMPWMPLLVLPVLRWTAPFPELLPCWAGDREDLGHHRLRRWHITCRIILRCNPTPTTMWPGDRCHRGANVGAMNWLGDDDFCVWKKNPELNYRERCSIGWYMVGYLGDDRTSQLHVHEWYEWAVWLFFSSWCERKRVMWSWGYEKL